MPNTPPDPTTALTWQQANLPPDQAAELLALADGLAAIGEIRSGRRAGQLSIFNFRLRAAIDAPANARPANARPDDHPPDDHDAPLVLLMRAGVWRRHTFFARFTPAADAATADTPAVDTPAADANAGDTNANRAPARFALSGPLDPHWDWRPPFEELRDRIVRQPVWLEAVGAPYDDRVTAFRAALHNVQPVPFANQPAID